MATIENTTRFPHLKFANTDVDGCLFGVLIVKGTFDVCEDGTCVVADEQEPLNFTDSTHGALNLSSLRHPSDLVAYKPATDIVVDAVAHAPGDKPSPNWIAGLRVEDETGQSVGHRVRVHGERHWQPRWLRRPPDSEDVNWRDFRTLFRGWELSKPSMITNLPIRYEFAFGGPLERGRTDMGEPIVETLESNPIGCGRIDREGTDHLHPVRAPQIEWPDRPILDPYAEHQPAGLGPIPPAWLPRRPLGGTFDDDWKTHVWPRWPRDYRFEYNNSAPAGLTHAPHLKGGLQIDLSQFRAGHDHFRLSVPNETPIIGARSRAGIATIYEPVMDTVFLSIAGADLFDWRVQVTWRLIFNADETELLVIASPTAEDRHQMSAGERRVEPCPHPRDCATETDLMKVTA